MALVTHSQLPAFDTLRAEGIDVATPGEATRSRLPDISIGLLNLMPDGALVATDRQFIRLAAAYADRADLWVFPFTLAPEDRGKDARAHIEAHYWEFGDIQASGVDALIVTGANPLHTDLTEESFWNELAEVLDWAETSTVSVLCSCLATHAVLEKNRLAKRSRLPRKCWGVYRHQVVADHPLVAGLAPEVTAPHSHFYDITPAQFESAGARVLVQSGQGVHLAVDADDFYLFFQGHPEYEPVSLLKEYQREVARFHGGERPDFPPIPEHYFDRRSFPALEEHRRVTETARSEGRDLPPLPEKVEITTADWVEPGRIVYRNWLQRVEQAKRN